MGYKLNLKQVAFLLDHFYAGVSLRKISRLFRATYGFPISPPTILRVILHWVPEVHEALVYFMERGELGEFQFGDVYEIDEMYVRLRKEELALIVVRDLKTGFDLGLNVAYPVTTEAVKVALEEAKATAKKCPHELRCDGLPVYEPAVKDVFTGKTTLSVNKRIGKHGQNQAMEGHNGVYRLRLNAMKSVHSSEKSPIIIRGMSIDNNFVNTSTALSDMTPAEVAQNKKSIDGNHSWLILLELAMRYRKNGFGSRRNRRFKGGYSTLDSFLF